MPIPGCPDRWPAAPPPPPAEGDQAALIGGLKSDAPLFNKAKACQRLAVIGDADRPDLPAFRDEQLMPGFDVDRQRRRQPPSVALEFRK